MTRLLIDADTLIFELEEWKKNPNNDNSSVDMINHFLGIIKALPSAEAEKPCKTCGYYNLECPKDCEYGRSLADRLTISGYIADDKEVPPYITTSAVSADRQTDGEWLTEYDYDSWKRGYEQGKLWAKAEMGREASAELPKGDLISRQWLLDLYGDYIGDNGDPKYHVPLEVVRQNIIDAPSADVIEFDFNKYQPRVRNKVNDDTPSADGVSEDTQTEERARFVAKETELAHIEARLENAEKRLQGACVANFVVEQLERLKDMTDEEKWEFFKRFFEIKGGDDE